jgi:type II secretory pathway component PulJ
LRADEAGFTVIELAVASLITLLVLGASLTVFEAIARQEQRTREHNEAQDRVRTATDRLARELRNLASPTEQHATGAAGTTPDADERNMPYDLVFKTVGDTRAGGSLNSANVQRVRYCLQTSGSTDAAHGVLWAQQQTWTTALAPAVPATLECPGTGWASSRIAAEAVVNRIGGRDAPVFRYSDSSGPITATDATARKDVSRIQTFLFVDPDPGVKAAESTITSSVLLRNQNREPVAEFTQEIVNPTTCTVLLNGSASADPESQALRYHWYDNGDKLAEEAIVVQTAVGAGVHNFQLKVYDPAGLEGVSTPKEPLTCT